MQVKGDILRLLFLRLSQQKQSKLEKQDNIQIEKQNNGL